MYFSKLIYEECYKTFPRRNREQQALNRNLIATHDTDSDRTRTPETNIVISCINKTSICDVNKAQTRVLSYPFISSSAMVMTIHNTDRKLETSAKLSHQLVDKWRGFQQKFLWSSIFQSKTLLQMLDETVSCQSSK